MARPARYASRNIHLSVLNRIGGTVTIGLDSYDVLHPYAFHDPEEAGAPAVAPRVAWLETQWLMKKAGRGGVSLLQIDAYSRAELHGPAAEAFAHALEDREVRKDLDRANLYNGACEACRTILAGLGKDAEVHVKEAIGWLKEDMRRRRDLLSAETIVVLEDEVRGDLEAAGSARLEQLRRETVEHFKGVHRGEPDLKMLHGMADFEALFERRARVAARPSMPKLGKKPGAEGE